MDEVYEVNDRGCFPYGFLFELKALVKLAWPTSLSILFHYFIQPVSLMFCGHLGKTELASAAMALSVIYITCISIGRGLAFGGDTFFSQTYGSTNKKMMGVYLQKGLIYGIFCSFIICALLVNTESLLLLIGQDPIVSKMAQEYTEIFMPGALAYCWIFTLMRYLLCQNSVFPNLIICIASCGFNALLHYALVYQAGMGIKGSAIALAMTYYLVFILLVSYIYGSGIYKETWPGWSRKCLEEWAPFAKVAISSIFMTFIFWLCTEIGTFLAGLQGEREISAFSICFQVEGFAWMIPLGLGGASTSRIGQYLGANHPKGAITTYRVAFLVQAIISATMCLLCYFLRFIIPQAFTSNLELISYTATFMPIVAIFVLLEGCGGVGMSIIRGTGRQNLGAIIIFISYYIFALPIGIPLMFGTYLKLSGLWWGYVIGLFVQNICLLIFVIKMDWKKEAEMAQIRAGINTMYHTNDDGHIVEDSETINERSGLINDSENNSTEPASLFHLVIYRLAIFLVFILVLIGGICIRMFVPLPPSHVTPVPIINITTTMPTTSTSAPLTKSITHGSINSSLYLLNTELIESVDLVDINKVNQTNEFLPKFSIVNPMINNNSVELTTDSIINNSLRIGDYLSPEDKEHETMWPKFEDFFGLKASGWRHGGDLSSNYCKFRSCNDTLTLQPLLMPFHRLAPIV